MFKFLKKEKYINHLVASFRSTYECGDMAAIMSLREGYTAEELKEILDGLYEEQKRSPLYNCSLSATPFYKTDPRSVKELDTKHRGH